MMTLPLQELPSDTDIPTGAFFDEPDPEPLLTYDTDRIDLQSDLPEDVAEIMGFIGGIGETADG